MILYNYYSFFFNLFLLRFFKDPLEQFDLINFFFSFNNAVLFLLIVTIFSFFFLFFLSSRSLKHSFYYFNLFIYKFIKSLIFSKIENRALAIRFVPVFYYLFLFILVSNYLGVIPFAYTITSMLILPFFLSITFFGTVIFVGLKKHSFVFFSGFLPGGVPSFVAPFLIVIELISYIMRVFSLAIRLFANILSGHILVKILISVCWALVSSCSVVPGFFAVVAVFLIIAIMFLEIIVCTLQAYVFVSLISMYLDEALKFGEH